MAPRPDMFHPLPELPSTAIGTTRQVPAYRDRATAPWSLLDPAECLGLSCALPARLEAHSGGGPPGVAPRCAPRGLATARHVRAMGQIVETRSVAPRQVRHGRPDGTLTLHASWKPPLP